MTTRPRRTSRLPSWLGTLFLGGLLAGWSGTARAQDSNLIAYWPLDEGSGTTANDRGPTGFNGTLTNGPTWVTTAPLGSAVNVDGSNDYVTISDDAALRRANGTSVTITAWIKADTISGYDTIVSKGRTGNAGNTTNYCLRLDDGKLDLYYVDASNEFHNYATTSAVISADRWHHVAAVYTFGTANTAKLYVDGVQITAASWTTTGGGTAGAAAPKTPTEALFFGGINPSGSITHAFDGSIDEVRIYGAILSASTIASMALRPRGWWKLDEGTGSTYSDSSGNGLNATAANGGPSWVTGKRGGYGVQCEGADDDYELVISDAVDPTAYTYTMWIKTSTASENIWERTDGAGSPYLSALYINGSGKPIHYTQDGSVKTVTGTTTVTDGQWHHIALVAANSGRARLYVDGTEEGTDVAIGTLLTTGDSYRICDRNLGLSLADYTGSIDDIRYYTAALSATEIAAIAAQKKYWVGSSTGAKIEDNGRWSLTSTGGANEPAPTAYDIAVFSATGSGSISSALSVLGIEFVSGFGGTITQSTTTAITVGTSGWTHAAGTFTGGSGRIDLNGDLSLTGGTFTSTSGVLQLGGAFSRMTSGTFAGNGGTVVFDSTSDESHTFGGQSFANVSFNDGLVGHWRLEETSAGTVADASGYGHSGTHAGNATASTTVPTLSFTDARSATFDGTDDYVSVSDTAALDFTTGDSITITAWVRPTNTATAYQTIVSKGYSTNGTDRIVNYAVRMGSPTGSGTDGKLTFFWYSTSTSLWNMYEASTNALSNNTWAHVAVTHTYGTTPSATSVNIYVNGVRATGAWATTGWGDGDDPPVTNDQALWLGALNNNATPLHDFAGQIDELRIYRRILPQTEIASMAAGLPPRRSSVTHTASDAFTATGDLTIASGTLAAGSQSVTVGGSWLNLGGNFTSTGTATLNATATGKSVFGGNASFYNLTLDGSGGGWTVQDRLHVANALTITTGTLDASSYTVRAGNVSKGASGTFTQSTSTVVLDASSNQTLTPGSGVTFNTLRVEDPTETGLVGYWKLDRFTGSTSPDSSGAGVEVTLTNGATPQCWGTATNCITGPSPGYDNPGGVLLDGTNDYVVSAATSDPSTSTFSLWVRPTTVTSRTFFHRASSADPTASETHQLRLTAASRFEFTLDVGGVAKTVTGTTTAVSGTWYHVAGVATAGGTMILYVNGTSEGTPVSIGTPDTAGDVYFMGAAGGPNASYFGGSLDDVRVYSTALTAAQIKALAAGRYPSAGGTATYTMGGAVTVGGTLAIDSGVLSSSASTLTAANSDATKVAYVNGGGLTVGSSSVIMKGGLTIEGEATLTMNTSGGSLQIGDTKSLVVNGTLDSSDTSSPTITAVSGSFTFAVSNTATSAATVNVDGLVVDKVTSTGMRWGQNAGTFTFTRFDNVSFTNGPGVASGGQYIRVYSTYGGSYVSNNLTFDGLQAYNIYLQGGSAGSPARWMVGNATCTRSPCETYDIDDDSDDDGVANGCCGVVQWVHRAWSDAGGTPAGFPVTAFNWNTFAYVNTYVAYTDASGTTDRLYARSADGAPSYSWDLPGSVGDLLGGPRFDTESNSQYVYVVTTLGYVYKLLDNGSAFSVVAGWPYHNGGSSTGTTALINDGTNVYWAGNDSGGSPKMFSLTYGKSLNNTRTVVSGVTATPALASVSGTYYLFNAANTKVYRTPMDLSSETTSTQPTSAVYGRLVALYDKLYMAEATGTIRVLGTDLSASWTYQDTDGTRHAGGCSADNQCRVRSFFIDLDPLLAAPRVFFGDKDGHVYRVSSGSAASNYPFRPGSSSDDFQAPPLYRSGLVFIGAANGNLYVFDQVNASSAPALVQTYLLGYAVSGISWNAQANSGSGAYMVATANGRLFFLTGLTDPTSGNN
jgi:hypothetical protein